MKKTTRITLFLLAASASLACAFASSEPLVPARHAPASLATSSSEHPRASVTPVPDARSVFTPAADTADVPVSPVPPEVRTMLEYHLGAAGSPYRPPTL